MKTFLQLVKRTLYRLVCWINYPTPRERMWGMYAMGKAQGRREALKELPIVQVQPKQVTEPLEHLHLPTGMWSKQWYETHPEHRAALPSQPAYWPEPIESFPAWLNSMPLKMQLPETTEEMPAVVKLLHERKYATRKLG